MEVDFKTFGEELLAKNEDLTKENFKLKKEVVLLTDINKLVCSFDFDKVLQLHSIYNNIENEEEFICNLKKKATDDLHKCGKYLIDNPEEHEQDSDGFLKASAKTYEGDEMIYLDLCYQPVSANNYY